MATSYKVYRDGALVGTSTAPPYIDTGLTNGQSYAYQVSAVNEGGESAKSSTVNATPVGSPPADGPWFLWQGTIPGGAKYYTGSGSLGSFLSGLSAGAVGVLDYDGEHTENITATLKDGITVLPGPARRPWLNGDLHLSCGQTATIYGLSVKYPNAPESDHVLDVKAGSINFGYAEVAYANCYTLIHPTGSVKNWRFHHLWVHDNLGVSSHDGNQDHGFYCSAPTTGQNGQIDHCLIENMPRGRNIKIGGASSGSAIGGIVVDKCTLKLGHGPSNGQVSNGATDTHWTNLVLIDSGASTNLTDGSGSGTGSNYSGCWSDKTTGPNSSHFSDAGGNSVKSASTLADYTANGAAGKGHLAS